MERANVDQTNLTAVILSAVAEFNQGLPEDQRIQETPEAVLFGRGGKLDSLGLVNLILTVEEHLQASLGVQLTLADERAMSQERSPFRSVSSLAAYIGLLLGEAAHA
jgi:acyl carrier protein